MSDRQATPASTGKFPIPEEVGSSGSEDARGFTPPWGATGGPFLPAVQITAVSVLSGAACFVYALWLSPARQVFAQPLPPIGAVFIDVLLATWIAFAVRLRPGSAVARLWPFLLWLLSLALFGYALYGAQANRWAQLTAAPFRGGWLEPRWQALVVALFASLLPLLLRLRRVRADSPWIRRMGVVAALVALLIALPARGLEEWAVKEAGRVVDAEVGRLEAVLDLVKEASGKPGKPVDAAKLADVKTKGAINEKETWSAAEAVGRTKRLQEARDAVAAIVDIVRKKSPCPPTPPVVPPPQVRSKPGFGVYSANDEITDYLQQLEVADARFENERGVAERGLIQAARLCAGLHPPKGQETDVVACESAEESTTCPSTSALSTTVPRAGIQSKDMVPGGTFYPFLDDVFFKTLFGRNKKALLAAGCYPVAPWPFNLIIYCNIYAPSEAKGERVRLQTWAAFGTSSGAAATDSSLPNQLFVTISTAGGTGARIHGRVFDDFGRKALADSPPYDGENCARGSCFLIDHGTQRIQVERHKSQESGGVLQLRARVVPGKQ